MFPHNLEVALSAGRADEAEAACRKALADDPARAEAHDLLGTLLRNRGQVIAAVASHRAAISLRPGVSQFHNNLGVALSGIGLLDEAAGAFRRALELAPDDPQVHGNLGTMLTYLGRLDEAQGVLTRAVALQPESSQARCNLGNVYQAAERFDQAIASYTSAIALDPGNGEAWCNLGVAQRSAGDLRQAIHAYDRAIELMPGSADAHMNRGVALDALGRRSEAIAAYRRAIGINPNLAKAHYNLANALFADANIEPAIDAYQRAIERRPDFVAAYSNLGNALMRLNRRDEAMAAYDRAIELDPASAEPHWNRALALLLEGDFQRGWPEHEWRNRLTPPSSELFPQPQWHGEALAGRTILLHAEHGLGDTLQFARYVPMVAARGGRVILRCRPELRELLKCVAGVDRLMVEGEVLPKFDVHCPLMSLPLAFGTQLESIPRKIPYLAADPARVERLQTRLAALSPAYHVGLVWAGSREHQYDRQRSIPLATLAPLSRVAGVRYFSLQKGVAAEQARHAPAGMDLIDQPELLKDYADTAALISQLDLVITVDTSVAHVAGALGKPVWVLVAFAPDWRWLLDREDSPWYPTMRLFRQKVRGEWGPVIEEVGRMLSEHTKADSGI
jgi:tetratricopeptide (TPR) repeat protein